MQHPASPGIRTAESVRKDVHRTSIVCDTIPEFEVTSVKETRKARLSFDEENNSSMGAFLTKKMSLSVIGRREEQQDERVEQLQKCDESKQQEIYERLVPFVPKEVLKNHRGTHERHASTIMLCDISGFTRMTERLSMKGVSGIASIHSLINTLFGAGLTIIEKYGGDVIHFAGDALIVRWVNEPRAQCACTAGMKLTAAELVPGLSKFQLAALRLSLSDEKKILTQVCTWYCVVLTGILMQRLGMLESVASASEVVVDSKTASDLTNGSWKLEKVHEKEAYRLLRTNQFVVGKREKEALPTFSQETCINELLEFAPGCVSMLHSVSPEIRLVSVVFLTLDAPCLSGENGLMGLNPDQKERAAFNELYAALMVELQGHGGFLRQFLIDDKGCVLIAAFGVPTFSYNDNAARAMECAARMLHVVRAKGGTAYAGVTTGRTYCGLIGTRERHEYAIVGDVVNLAARLMSRAAKNQETGILADALSHHEYRIQRTQHETLDVEMLGGILVKGKQNPVQIVRAKMRHEAPTGIRLTVGWEEEIADVQGQIDETLRSVHEAGIESSNRIVILSSDAGFGKTHFLQTVVQDIEIKEVYVRAHSRDVKINMRFFHKLFQMVCSDGGRWDASIVPTIEKQLYETPNNEEESNYATVSKKVGLQRLLGTYDSPCREMDEWITSPDEAVLDVLNDVIHLLCRQGRMPSLLRIDDAHLVDLTSWELLLAWSNCMPSPFIILLTSLPSRGKALDWFVAQTTHSGNLVSSMRLGPLKQEDLGTLVRKAFHDVEWSDEVLDYLACESSGSPFLCKEMARGLYSNAIESERKCVQIHDTSTVSFDIENAVTLRIDALSMDTRNVVKCASVLGGVFNLHTLAYLVGNVEGRRTTENSIHLSASLSELVSREILLTSEQEGVYHFRHETVRVIIYNMLTPQDASIKHNQVAYYIESNYKDLRPHFNSLIWHYVLCQQYSRAMIYTIHAMRNCVSLGLIKEATLVSDAILQHPIYLTDLLSLRSAVTECIQSEHRHLAHLMDRFARRKQNRRSTLQSHRRTSVTSTNVLYDLVQRISDQIQEVYGTDRTIETNVACSVPKGCVGCVIV